MSSLRHDDEEVDFDEEGERGGGDITSSLHPEGHPPPSSSSSSPPRALKKRKSEGQTSLHVKGRGHRSQEDRGEGGRPHSFEVLGGEGGGEGGAAKSIEGWVIMVTGLHEEAQEDEVVDRFGEFGEVRNVQMNLDRRTGFVKGYALVEFTLRKEAEAAIEGMEGEEMYGKEVRVDWAFMQEAPGR
ncbi:hypothetical protein NSK_008495 [Nannochloropsis salina CCMP1776]|jgi:RNA-binding protein 8A|uniref:RRM domain-containing protein n=1 Tax=Nannochloropsis salina CCMP1776 TaxID=1027361 RepID=A0A4D9CNT1_9STRA|nr:hypothetical protein NSK_008495 [Nannochloropsis salina CCMP1776]|eukprot:TFJ80174.1 hypothetical protein NSK_008495 [Nannochloropsis salina CCMP1776]